MPEQLISAPGAGESWLWLLDEGVFPEPDALDRLLEVAGALDPTPVLLASRVLAPDGTLDWASSPVPDVHRSDRVLAALEHRCVALRAARRGALLVRADALEPLGIRPFTALSERDVEWTAKLLSGDTGVLVPASVAIRAVPLRPPRPRPRNWLRLLATLESRERLWFTAHLIEREAKLIRSAVAGGWTRSTTAAS
jgi:hypothetical protein